ncbi:hypothetical protein Q4Q84_17045, partial [Morganella morganii]
RRISRRRITESRCFRRDRQSRSGSKSRKIISGLRTAKSGEIAAFFVPVTVQTASFYSDQSQIESSGIIFKKFTQSSESFGLWQGGKVRTSPGTYTSM